MTTLAVRNLAVKRGARLILEDVTLSASAGELIAVTGVSGTGKTTLLRAISGLDRINAGSIEVGNVSMVLQFHHLFSHLSALENVWLAPVHVLRQARSSSERRARELLDMLGVGGRSDALPHELSGGEAQRVAIARALAVDPSVLLMDEPTASLDAERRGELASTLRDLAASGRTVIVATHDTEFVRACARRWVLLDEGRIVREGVPADLIPRVGERS
jgi:polar amino acid transport system ATP-binding protein